MLDAVSPVGYNQRVSCELNLPPLTLRRTSPPSVQRHGAIPKRQASCPTIWRRRAEPTSPRLRRPGTRRGYTEKSVERGHAHRARLQGRGRPTNMCFCETNPNCLTCQTAFIQQGCNELHDEESLGNSGSFSEAECISGGACGSFPPCIPKLTPMHLASNVTRHARC
jgi:hypothetical protein